MPGRKEIGLKKSRRNGEGSEKKGGKNNRPAGCGGTGGSVRLFKFREKKEKLQHGNGKKQQKTREGNRLGEKLGD